LLVFASAVVLDLADLGRETVQGLVCQFELLVDEPEPGDEGSDVG